jgi:hypothetical protein
LISTTIKAVAGEELVAVVSASVVELVQGMTTAIVINKAKKAALILLAVTLLGGASVWTLRSLVANMLLPTEQSAGTTAVQEDDKPRAISPKREKMKTMWIHGRVFAPDGKPREGALARNPGAGGVTGAGTEQAQAGHIAHRPAVGDFEPCGRLNLAGTVAVRTQEHADDLVDDSRLVGVWLDA